MAFYGLFIGVDRYESPRISWLSCAGRDARALQAIFDDNLGGSTTLLVDKSATREAIELQLAGLSRTEPDDVVVVAFSGHGTPTHELVTYNADPDALPTSAIPLDLLTEWLARIPAKRLVCILDCCFSGGAGSKLFETEIKARDTRSTAELLDQMSGDGRFIFTASLPTEPAYENQKLKHGLLTFYLLESLMGAEEVRQGGQVSVYRLLEYVTDRVQAAANQIGRPQHPSFRGTLDGSLTWPVFVPGAKYLAAFPDRGKQPVTSDLSSLSSYGLPGEVIEAWAGSIASLNKLQLDAINQFGVLDGDHLLVSAPTSSGKTMIGELAALRGILQRQRALFLMPLRALVNDKHEQFERTYGQFGLRTIRATGEIADDIPSLMRGQYDICLMTYEKFAALALGAPYILNQVGTVVVDEIQMIADSSRGANLEFLLTLLRMRRRQGIEPQIVALSAVIGDTNGLESWLDGRLLRRDERPVPLDEGVLLRDGTFRFVESESGEEHSASSYIQPAWSGDSSQHWIIPLVQKLVAEGKQIIVFRETRGEARGCAGYLARELRLPPATEALTALPEGDPSQASAELRRALSGGVAFHISDLDRDERSTVEAYFRQAESKIRVIAATTTLAMGINTPADAVVIAGLEHPGGEPYSVAEYKNIVGRAGRLGFVSRGYSYLLTLNPRQEHDYWTRYVIGRPEEIRSRFVSQATDIRSLIVRVLVSVQGLDGQGVLFDDVIDFLESSFGVFVQKRETASWIWDRGHLQSALDQLVRHGLVALEGSECRLTELGTLAGEAGVEIESVIRLVAALSQLHATDLNDQTLIAATQLTVELDQVLFPVNRKSTQKEPYTWRAELSKQGVAAAMIQALHVNVRESLDTTRRAKRAVACLLWMSDISMEELERILTQFGGGLGGAAGAIRGTASRTADLVPTVARIGEILNPGLALGDRVGRVLTRLEIGLPPEALELAMETGSRISRGDYLQLLRDGLCDISRLDEVGDDAVLRCVGQSQTKLQQMRRAAERIRKSRSDGQDRAELPTYTS